MTEAEELELLELEEEEARLKLQASQQPSAQLPQEESSAEKMAKYGGSAIQAGAQQAIQSVASQANPLRAVAEAAMTPEGRGVGQGVIQGATFGYGMPTIRKALPEISKQIPPPTPTESTIGSLLSAVVPATALSKISQIPKIGKVAGAIAPAVMGYAQNPSDTELVPAASPKRAIGAALVGGAQMAGNVAQKALGALYPRDINALTRAIMPTKTNKYWNRDAQTSLPIIQKTAKTENIPIDTVEDFVSVTQKAKQNIWKDVKSVLSKGQEKIKAGEASAIKGDDVVTQMQKSVSPQRQELSPEFLDAVNKRAEIYKGKNLDIDTIEDKLQLINSQLTNYYKSNYRGAYVKENTEDIAAMIAERAVLKDQLKNKLDSITGTNVDALKRKYGSLMNVMDEATGRINVSNRQKPVSLQEAINGTFGLARAATGDLSGLLQLGASQAIKKLNSSNYLVKRAVQTVGKQQTPIARVAETAAIIGARQGLNNQKYEVGKYYNTPKGQVSVTGYDSDGEPLVIPVQ